MFGFDRITEDNAERVIAYWTILLVVGTFFLVAVTGFAVWAAFRGARYAREAIENAADENRKWNTLNICAQFELSSSISPRK
jgi:hypothetical protein